jgi:hypothetical protein
MNKTKFVAVVPAKDFLAKITLADSLDFRNFFTSRLCDFKVVHVRTHQIMQIILKTKIENVRKNKVVIVENPYSQGGSWSANFTFSSFHSVGFRYHFTMPTDRVFQAYHATPQG